MAAARDVEEFLGGLGRPDVQQERCLLQRVIGPNRESEYGRRHGFRALASVRDYQRAVPIVRYGDIEAEIQRSVGGEAGVLVTEPVRRVFLTSGSSSKPKTIPVTSSFIGDKSRAFGLYWGLLFDRHPAAGHGKVVGNFSESGGARRLPSGLPASSEGGYWSAVGAVMQQRGKSPIPTCVSAIPDPDARYYAVARILAEEDVSLLMALNPSTILLLLRKMDEYRDLLLRDVEYGGLSSHFEVSAEVREHVATRYRGNPARAAELRGLAPRGDALFAADRVWPDLDLVVSWRSPAQRPYLKLLEPYLGAVAQRDYILMASEGVIAIPHEDDRSGGLLATTCHFYEFVPEEEAGRSSPSVLLAQDLEVGRSYVVVLSTSAGLYRYEIGDVVRVTGHRERTPIVEFLHRAGATSSLTGEKLTEDQVTAAVAALGEKSGLALEGFTLLPAGEGFPRYVLLAEFATLPDGDGARRLPRALDSELAERNIEYAAKRRSQRLGAPEVWMLAPGSYEKLRRARVADGANEAQIKPVALVRDPRFAERFEVVARAHAD